MADALSAIADQCEELLTASDVKTLETLGHSEEVMSRLATAHAARTQALLRCCGPRMQRNLLLMISKQLLKDADNVDVSLGSELCEGQPGASAGLV